MPKPKALIIPVTPFQQNCCLLWQEETNRGAVIDPGGDVAEIVRAIEQSG
ncbi:MAG: MBL fold metallo-hydrolase, partial [Pseudomonadota bacterium]|nr:MBL fold metallo-hydrolase [Pseudomonadota bacterium]